MRCSGLCDVTDAEFQSLRLTNTGLVSSWVSVTSWEERALVAQHAGYGASIKLHYGVDVMLNRPILHYMFTGLLKTETDALDQLRLT